MTWALDLLNPNQSKIALDIAGSYTMGSLSVTNNTSIFGDLYIGTASVNRNIYLNGNLFNGSITGILPDGGVSLVNSSNAIRGIVPSTGITITSDSNRLIISSSLSPTVNYTAGGLTVNNNTTLLGDLNVGTSTVNRHIYFYSNLYRHGVLFNSVVSNTIPTNGFSLVNSDNTIKCILPGTNTYCKYR